MSPPDAPSPSRWRPSRLQWLGAAIVRGFHAYANWLVGITWTRFIVLSVLLLLAMGLLSEIPPFNWVLTETVSVAKPPAPPVPPRPATASSGANEPLIKIEKAKPRAPGEEGGDYEVTIDENGIRVTPRPRTAAAAASAAASAAEAAQNAAGRAASAAGSVQIIVPPGATSAEVREAVELAREDIEAAVERASEAAEEARRDAEEALRDAEAALEELRTDNDARIVRVTLGDSLPTLAMLWIVASIIIKITYKGRMQAEVKAAQATEVAEAELLKRQVVEARMAAMQAQVEPHFLFNTLASIDHLIETDPPRASRMQKNLIALLRASMPTMREANTGGVRDLGRELAVIRPYLEILKVRMEERLQTVIDVPEGLLSAQFPPMMIQGLVENAIKHGLEPKPEGGSLTVTAQIVHGKLQVSVADTGLGFGRAATAGTGVGLANIRERLQLLFGSTATLTVSENQPCGTRVTIAVPYATRAESVPA